MQIRLQSVRATSRVEIDPTKKVGAHLLLQHSQAAKIAAPNLLCRCYLEADDATVIIFQDEINLISVARSKVTLACEIVTPSSLFENLAHGERLE